MSCPDLESLVLLRAGGPDAARGAEVEAHLGGCASCRDLLAEIDADEELARRIRAWTVDAGDALAATVPASVAGYRIVREIHRGGQGAVFEAVQESTSRRVALKLLRSGPFASPRERLRFDREIELAARLRHPHIVTVHDAGVTADGWPYLAMELVDGGPLAAPATGVADGARLSVALVRRISEAVHFAHLRGVLHRDLKPSNILVDAKGEPRVLDFGVAKPMDAAGPAFETLETAPGEFVGTLAYAAPEQLREGSGGVDVRTDVHALGVILYELLTGGLPYDVRGPLPRVVRSLLDSEPRRPSAARPGIDRDLEAILLQALAKEKERRYQSAGDLARDLENWLARRPVAARSGSRWYLLRRTLRRHWLAAGAAAAVLVTLAAATVVSLAFGRESERERGRAESEWRRAETARGAAERDARRLGATNRFWRQLLENAGRGPEGEEARLADLVAEGERLLAGSVAEGPEILAAFHDALGSCCRSLGRAGDAERHYAAALDLIRGALGPDAPDTLAALVNLATARVDLGRSDDAETLLRDAVAGFRKLENRGRGIAFLVACGHLGGILRDRGEAGAAADLLGEGLESPFADAAEPGAGRARSMARSLLAMALSDLGRLEEAEAAARQAVEDAGGMDGAGGFEASIGRARLGAVLLVKGRAAEAAAMLEEALGGLRGSGRSASAVRLETRANLAACLLRLGRAEDALARYEEALAEAAAAPDEDARTLLAVQAEAAWLQGVLGRSEDAAERLRGILRTQRETPGVRPLEIVASMRHLAGLLVERGRAEEAEPLARKALETARASLGAEHPDVAEMRAELGRCRKELGRLDEAANELEAARAALERLAGAADPRTLRAANDLGFVFMEQKRFAEAEPLLAQVRRASEESLPSGDLHRAIYRRNHGLCLFRLGRPAEAAPLLASALAAIESSPGASPLLLRSTLDLLIEVHEALGLPDEAARYRLRAER